MEIRDSRIKDLEPEIQEMYNEMTAYFGTKRTILSNIKNDRMGQEILFGLTENGVNDG